MSSNSIIVGLDFGGVLGQLNGAKGAEHIDTAINMPDAIDTLSNLLDPTMTTRTYMFKIISFCGYARAVQTHRVLETYPHLFNEIYFVKDRSFKAELCKYLGCHIMVDDRVEILNNVRRLNPHIITVLFGTRKSPLHKNVRNWKELCEMIQNYRPVLIVPDSSVIIRDLIHDVGR